MSKLMTGLLALVLVSTVLAATTFFVLRPRATNALAPETVSTSVASSVDTAAPVVAQAKVVPVRSAELNFVGETSVTEVLVREGDMVEQGALLARLDTRDLELRVEEARAALAQARAEYDKLVAESSAAQLPAPSVGASPVADTAAVAALAGATARIQQAETALKRAELALEQAVLRAPMAGTVVDVNLSVGEVPSSAEPAIVLADVSTWLIETNNLTEQSVVQIRENAPVTITLNALPGLELAGKVTQIKPIGQATPNDTSAVYTVIITPEQQDERLRWNMTALVAIAPNQ